MATSESLALARNIVDIHYDDIPRSVLDITKKSILDALGVTLAASSLGEGCKQFIDLAIAQGGKRESTIIGFGAKVPAPLAAFANGSMAHSLDFEDAHDAALVHPNAATLPAALAVAESLGNVTGKEFLTAVVLGSDLVCRLGLALNEDLLKYGWYMPPILGAFGATAAASKLLRLNERQILDAFSLTLCQATCSAELTHSTHSIIRSIRDAFSAQAGVLSALLARKGVAGFDQPIEGKAGLFSMYARGNYDPAKLVDNLGKTFEGGNVSFKPWPSCRGTHSYIDALLQVVDKHDLKPDDVEVIKVIVSPVNKMLCHPPEIKRNPATAIDAKFSLPFVLAVALTRRRVSLDDFAPQELRNRDVLAVAQRVCCDVDASLDTKGASQGALQLSTTLGAITRKMQLAYGHPQNPISQEALVAKFLDCAGHSARRIPRERLDELIRSILSVEELENVAQIVEAL